MGKKERLLKNTLYLYLRTLFVMGVSIFTSRIILDALGVEDYGIYNVVGGFVSMFSILSGTLTAASQRFIAFELGKTEKNTSKIFSTTVTIHVLLAIISFILLESFGLWFLNYKMNINADRINAANWVFQCSVITFCINLISIPYNAAIIAYEKMSAFAYISIFEVICKLGAVYALYIIAFDSLITYAIFMLAVALLLRLIYSLYCKIKIPECKYTLSFEKKSIKELLAFCGWNFIGSSAAILNGQGINMLSNLFFGVTVNAARGIASQIDSALNTFVQNFMMALNPQITKFYAAGDFANVNKMILSGTKTAFFLFFVFCLPVFINMDFILSIWLKQVPEHAISFAKLGIIYTLFQNLSQCLYTTMLATGNIKKYQIIVGSLSILAFPAAWLGFRLGLPSEWGYWTMIIFSVICLIARIFIIKGMVPLFSSSAFIKKAILPIIFTTVPPTIIAFYLHTLFNTTTIFVFFIEIIASMTLSIICIYYLGLTTSERVFATSILKKKILHKG